ncbi:serine protease 23-like [Asterias rubens]|uniref:serine protease 23-like n=1 Tax=Asterias rubens TaxID=7604 RepID=UPI001455633C|nr:serine protease 23-like [Asterias rubens]
MMLNIHAVCVLVASLSMFASLVSASSVHAAADKWHRFKLPKPEGAGENAQAESVILDEEVEGSEEDLIKQDKETVNQDGISLYCDAECEVSDVASQRNYTVDEAEEMLAFETLYPNGTRTLTRPRVQEKMVNYINRWTHTVRKQKQKAAGGAKRRRKRAVFGLDSRFEINVMKYVTMYPFSATVKLSVGCSGVLIAPQYVLTSAHCIHNGKRYVVDVKEIRAGFRREREPIPGEDPDLANAQAFFWIRASKVYLPYDWTNKKSNQLLPLDKDYAVILLKRSPERQHLEVGIGDTGNIPLGTMVHFASFDIPDDPTLFYRFCTVNGGTQHLFYQQCDGSPTSIGSGIYVRQWEPDQATWSRKVIGIYGGFTSYVNSFGIREEQNVAMRITPLKFAQICYWITGDYGECKG